MEFMEYFCSKFFRDPSPQPNSIGAEFGLTGDPIEQPPKAAWLKELRGEFVQKFSHESLVGDMIEQLSGSSFFVTETGRMGMIPSLGTSPGDKSLRLLRLQLSYHLIRAIRQTRLFRYPQ
jgi:hypothetical protein